MTKQRGDRKISSALSFLYAQGVRLSHKSPPLFTGVIFTRADNKRINNLDDLKESVVGALEIGDFAGAQAQFYTMGRENLNYIMDPKQVIFVGNQIDIVHGVANGDWEVGMVRTGMVETMVDENGEPYDPNLFKVLNPKIYVMDDGSMFPFLHSTPAFPEWPVYAAVSTPRDVMEEVQEALMALGEHKSLYEKILDCKKEFCVEQNCTTTKSNICETSPIEYFDEGARCDSSREIAELAYAAGKAGKNHGFRIPRSYFGVRTMQEEGGFLGRDNQGKCTHQRIGHVGTIPFHSFVPRTHHISMFF